MVKQIHRQILRMLPGPFLGWLATLIFLLIMQFLIRYLPDLVGRGLPVKVIFEIVIYNLAYMVVLAVPMSVLIATLMTFGKLAEANVYTVLKSAGVSLMQLMWPVLIVSTLLAALMWNFNSNILPAANYRASTLWKDIRKKKPGFELSPGVFYNGIDDYSILVQELPAESNEMIDVVIFDYSAGNRQQVTIKAERGELRPQEHNNTVELVLHNGEMHRIIPAKSRKDVPRYERLKFKEHHLSLDLSELSFERSDPEDGYRSDRTMPSHLMIRYVDSLNTSVGLHREKIQRAGLRFLADSTYEISSDQPVPLPEAADGTAAGEGRTAAQIETTGATNTAASNTAPASQPNAQTRRVALRGLTRPQQVEVYEAALNNVRAARTHVDNVKRSIEWESERANRYQVEIYKKYSIAVACIIFALIGIPLGLSMRRGGLGAVGATALGIFMFYWVTLVQGEKLADRGKLEPWVGMWGANIVMLVIASLLIAFVLLDLRARAWFKKKPAAPTQLEEE
ncbi:MAG: LptF/LptG family permease [Bacteroidota bacterium]